MRAERTQPHGDKTWGACVCVCELRVTFKLRQVEPQVSARVEDLVLEKVYLVHK